MCASDYLYKSDKVANHGRYLRSPLTGIEVYGSNVLKKTKTDKSRLKKTHRVACQP